jgi:hypothetical protein
MLYLFAEKQAGHSEFALDREVTKALLLCHRIKAHKMSAILNSIRFKALFLVVAILLIVAATTAAASDWHGDLRYHKGCVLCQLAQLSIVELSTGLDLPPPSIAALAIPLLAALHIQTTTISLRFVRSPPA